MNVSDILGDQAAPLTLDHAGKTYKAHPLTQTRKTMFERWLKQQVLDAFLDGKEGEDRTEAIGVVADRIAGGRYSFHGPVAVEAMKGPAGVLALGQIVFDCPEDEMIALMAAQPKKVGTLLGLVFRQSFPQALRQAAGEEGADPNPPGPGAEAATRPAPSSPA